MHMRLRTFTHALLLTLQAVSDTMVAWRTRSNPHTHTPAAPHTPAPAPAPPPLFPAYEALVRDARRGEGVGLLLFANRVYSFRTPQSWLHAPTPLTVVRTRF